MSGPRTALPCDIGSMINPISQGLLQYIPLPNLLAPPTTIFSKRLCPTIS